VSSHPPRQEGKTFAEHCGSGTKFLREQDLFFDNRGLRLINLRNRELGTSGKQRTGVKPSNTGRLVRVGGQLASACCRLEGRMCHLRRLSLKKRGGEAVSTLILEKGELPKKKKFILEKPFVELSSSRKRDNRPEQKNREEDA